jgi:hypothetical protein
VSDGARTRDTQDHNLVLYRLSYTHHAFGGRSRTPNPRKDTGERQPSDTAGAAASSAPASPAASSAANEPTTSSAAVRA